MPDDQPKKRGPAPDILKITLPVREGLRRLVTTPPITTKGSRYSKRKPKPKRTA